MCHFFKTGLLKLAPAKVTESFFVKHLKTKWVHNGKPLHINAHWSREIILLSGGFKTLSWKLQGIGYEEEINPGKIFPTRI